MTLGGRLGPAVTLCSDACPVRSASASVTSMVLPLGPSTISTPSSVRGVVLLSGAVPGERRSCRGGAGAVRLSSRARIAGETHGRHRGADRGRSALPGSPAAPSRRSPAAAGRGRRQGCDAVRRRRPRIHRQPVGVVERQYRSRKRRIGRRSGGADAAHRLCLGLYRRHQRAGGAAERKDRASCLCEFGGGLLHDRRRRIQ